MTKETSGEISKDTGRTIIEYVLGVPVLLGVGVYLIGVTWWAQRERRRVDQEIAKMAKRRSTYVDH